MILCWKFFLKSQILHRSTFFKISDLKKRKREVDIGSTSKALEPGNCPPDLDSQRSNVAVESPEPSPTPTEEIIIIQGDDTPKVSCEFKICLYALHQWVFFNFENKVVTNAIFQLLIYILVNLEP